MFVFDYAATNIHPYADVCLEMSNLLHFDDGKKYILLTWWKEKRHRIQTLEFIQNVLDK